MALRPVPAEEVRPVPTGAAALEADGATEGGIAPLNRDSSKTRMDRAEDARLPHTERQSRPARATSALP
eukprot:scaffold74458_cov20-Phaeocystis_antarctica.AAC.1